MLKTLPISIITLSDTITTQLLEELKSVAWASEVIVVSHNSVLSKKLLQTELQLSNDELSALPPITFLNLKFSQLNFAQLRNEAMANATYDWVLFIDSDEIFPEDQASQLETLINQTEVVAYQVHRQDYFHGRLMKWGEVRNVWVTRLLNKYHCTWQRAVHETVLATGKTKRTQVTLKHFPHQSFSSFIQKIYLYSQLDAQYRIEQKQTPKSWQLFIWPIAKFIQNFILRFGFLDGWRGLIYAVAMSTHSFCTRALLYEKNHSQT